MSYVACAYCGREDDPGPRNACHGCGAPRLRARYGANTLIPYAAGMMPTHMQAELDVARVMAGTVVGYGGGGGGGSSGAVMITSGGSGAGYSPGAAMIKAIKGR